MSDTYLTSVVRITYVRYCSADVTQNLLRHTMFVAAERPLVHLKQNLPKIDDWRLSALIRSWKIGFPATLSSCQPQTELYRANSSYAVC